MTLVINTNITSSLAQSNLTKIGEALQTTTQRLSSGLRINSAADDASGYAIANRMDSQIRGMAAATRNANDAISFVQTTSGALSQISSDLQRMRELAVQAANGSNSSSDTSLLNQEFNQLQTEVSRIQNSTSFNGINVFNSTDTVFQIGANTSSNDSVNFQGNALSNTLTLGTLTITDRDSNTALTDITNAFTNANNYATNSITTGTSSQVSYLSNAVIDAVNSNQKISFAAKNDLLNIISSATNSALATGMNLTDFSSNLSATISTTVSHTFGPQVTISATNVTGATLTTLTASLAAVYTNSQLAGTTLNSVYTGIKAAVDIAGGNNAIIDAQLLTAYNTAVSGGMTAAQFGTKLRPAGQLITGGATPYFGLMVATSTSTNNALNATQAASSSQTNAQSAISSIDSALTEINNASAKVGAMLNRLSAIVNHLSVFSQSQSSAKSRIVDADFAAETSNLSKNQILQEAGTAMLAQANQSTSSVLSLLK